MKRLAFAAALVVTTALTAPAFAATTYTDLSAWQAAAGTFSRDTQYGTTFTTVPSLTLSDGTLLGFSPSVQIRAIGDGWATWSGGYTDQLVHAPEATTVDLTFSPLGGFGFFIEPNPFSIHSFTMTLSDGSVETAAYDGSGGAGFLGFIGSGVTGLKIESDADFALGDFYTTLSSAVPEPATWGMMIVGFGLLGAAMRRRRPAVTAISYV